MDLTFSPEHEAFRAEARAWLAAHVPADPLPSLDTAAGFTAHRAWEHTLFEDRWSVVSWPTEYGGRDLGIIEWLVFEEEYYRARAPKRVSQNGIFLLAPTMLEYGTEAQKARFLPPMASGDEIWCQGWSEPDAGSDLAGIRSRAARDPAHEAAGSSTARRPGPAGAPSPTGASASSAPTPKPSATGPHVFPHRHGHAGVTMRPIPQIDGETGFAEIFFDNVEVPEDQVLGEIGAGWSVEVRPVPSAASRCAARPATPRRPTGSWALQLRGGPTSSADAVAQVHMDAEAYKLHTYWTATQVARGHAVGPEASCNKIFWSETDGRSITPPST